MKRFLFAIAASVFSFVGLCGPAAGAVAPNGGLVEVSAVNLGPPSPYASVLRLPKGVISGPGGIPQGTPTGTFLNSGVANTFTLPVTQNPSLMIGTLGFRVNVPAGATRVDIALTGLTPGAELDMAARFGSDLFLQNGQVGGADFTSYTPGGNESITINNPQQGVYFIGFVKLTTPAARASIIANIQANNPIPPIGGTLQSGTPANFNIPAQQNTALSNGPAGFRINIPSNATRLAINLSINTGAPTQIFARQGFDVQLIEGGVVIEDWSSGGGNSNQSLTILTTTNPPLQPGVVFIGFGILNTGIAYNGSITATVTTSGGNPPMIGLSTTQLSFSANVGQNPAQQNFTVANSGQGTLNYTISDNQNWLTVGPTSGSSTGAAQSHTVTIDTSGLAAGQQFGTITITETGGSGIRTITVALDLGGVAPPQILLSTQQINVTLVQGESASRNFTVTNSGGGSLGFQVSSNQPWLTAQPPFGNSTGAAVTVQANINSTGLTLGQHDGVVTIEDTTNMLTGTVNVTLNVTAPLPAPSVTVSTLSFQAMQGSGNPAPKTFSVANSGAGTLNFNVTSSQPWLIPSPTAGSVTTNFQQINVSVDIAGLAPGSHSGSLTVAAAGAALSAPGVGQGVPPAVVQVTLFIEGGGGIVPVLPDNAMVNAASFVPAGQPVHATAPGSIVSIFGQNFVDPAGAQVLFIAASQPLPIVLGGVSVEIDGIPAPLFFVSPGQINCQLPFGATPGQVTIIIRGPLGQVQAVAQVADYSPGSFTANASGSGQAVATIAFGDDFGKFVAPSNFTVNGIPLPSRPGVAGDVVTLWFNGLGPVDNPISDGFNSCNPDSQCLPDFSNLVIRNTTSRPIVRIGGVQVPDANILFSGLAPLFVGLFQVNIILPAGLPSGDAVSLTIEIGGIESLSNLTIAIQ